MVKIIMHGCNGHMGQVISEIVEKDPNAQIVAGIDIADQGKNSYPVFTNIDECQVGQMLSSIFPHPRLLTS